MWIEDTAVLVCPDCRQPMTWEGTNLELQIADGAMICSACGIQWPARDGWLRFYRAEQVRRRDRQIHRVLDGLPRLHDPVIRALLPISHGTSARVLGDAVLDALNLDALPADVPVRVLEIGISTAAHLDAVQAHLPAGSQVWGTDLSTGLLAIARSRVRGNAALAATRLLLADAHRLPFHDGFFDRVFRVSGSGGVRDPAPAFAEMARVARPGSVVCGVVDRLDPDDRASWLQRKLFREMADPHDPVRALPVGATDVQVRQVGRYYAALSFRMPG